MFFLVTVFELILLVSGISMFHQHRVGMGGAMVLLAIVLFLVTSAGYAARRRSYGLCGDLECGFLEGLACAECVDAGAGGGDCLDCGAADCGVMDCGN